MGVKRPIGPPPAYGSWNKRPRMGRRGGFGLALGQFLAYQINKAMTTKTANRNAGRGPGAGAVTSFQNDVTSVYRRKRSSRRRVRRSRLNRRRTTAAISSLYPFNTHHLNFAQVSAVAAASQTSYFIIPYYTGNSSVSASVNPSDRSYHAQMEQIFTAYATNPQTTESRILFTDCDVEVTLASVNDSPIAAIVTMYFVRCRRNSLISMPLLYERGIAAKPFSNVPNNTNLVPLTVNNLSATPFDSSLFCKHFLITSVKKLRLESQSSVTFKMRDRRIHSVSSEDINYNYTALGQPIANSCIKGLTKGVLIFFHGTPNAGQQSASVQLAANANIIYRFKVMQRQISSSASQSVINP